MFYKFMSKDGTTCLDAVTKLVYMTKKGSSYVKADVFSYDVIVGILSSDEETIYYASRYVPGENTDGFDEILVYPISSFEYEKIIKSKEAGNENSKANPNPAPIHLKTQVINTMTNACAYEIKRGFSFNDNDGNAHFVELTNEDQLNLLSIENTLAYNPTMLIPFHFKGEEEKLYEARFIKAMIQYYRAFVAYYRVRLNKMKAFVNSLDDNDPRLHTITFYDPIPDVYKDSAFIRVYGDYTDAASKMKEVFSNGI